MKQIQARESGAAYRKKNKGKDELLKHNEGSLLKFVTQGESQNEIPPRNDDALNQTAESEMSVNVKDDDLLQVAQSESEVHQHPESQSTHEYVSDEEEDNSYLSSPTSNDNNQYGPAHNNPIRCDKTEPQQVDLTDAALWPEFINDDTRMILVQQGSSIVQHLNSAFSEVIVIRNDGNVFKKCKGEIRKMSRECFFF